MLMRGLSTQPLSTQQQQQQGMQQQQLQQQQQQQQQQLQNANSMYGSVTVSQKISDYLNDNNRLITQSYIAQCNEQYSSALDNLDKLVVRMISMMENADRNHKTRQVIYENRELLSESQIKQYHEINQANHNKKIEKRPGKKKVFWTEQEKAQFKEALQKFGKKDLKKLSEYIGTKKPVQVRSHMQKYFKRLEKETRQALESQQSTSEKKKKSNEDTEKQDGLQGLQNLGKQQQQADLGKQNKGEQKE